MSELILNTIKEHKSGKPAGIYSVCSANRFVLEASMLHAKEYDNYLLIEATSNQVDQFGGYTGLTPSMFRDMIKETAETVGYPFNKIVLGGDHLGPNVWQDEDSDIAMNKAEEQIREYVKAGFTKIHLDTSMACRDDRVNEETHMLDPEIITERAARLCRAAEDVADKNNKPVYIIGTDVPIPGGSLEKPENIRITKKEEVEETISLTKKAYSLLGLDDAWKRTIAVVVQPGVEFSDSSVVGYDRKKANELISKIKDYDNFVYEAHSTDFQTKQALREMVVDHFCILKVGPWLTFALREAVFALSEIEEEILTLKKNISISNIRNTLESQMLMNPKYWKKHYEGTAGETAFSRKYSYSDRIRYYWTNNDVQNSLIKLLNNLTQNIIPLSLLSQFLPDEYEAIMEGRISVNPADLIHHKIQHVLNKYSYAVNGGRE
ncbi:MAG: class II D-tagatose-bisphosphate aldolase, non-catalytic subunit [Ignavibacteriaceae bacterium]